MKGSSLNEASVVGYCSHHMQNEDYKSLRPRALMAVLPGCGAHYVMIVGQRKKQKSCQVLIRNSHNDRFWGREDQTCYCKFKDGSEGPCKKDEYSKEDSVLACYYNRDRFLGETFDVSFFK